MAKTDTKQQFEGQRSDEVVMDVFRRHMIALRKGFYMVLIPFTISAIPPLIWQTELWLYLLPMAGLAIGLFLFFFQWINWYFTVFIITNQRVRQITQRGMFGKDVVDLDVSNIQNISYTVPGFTGEILGFGTIIIQTIVGDLVLDKIHHPAKIYNALQDLVRNVRNGQTTQSY